mmetsp:Transcript_28305/g.76677  ORF Transcript_28305/g.76677 Transcript_28305/m.76677 type:complete len:226 (+) Transcript_28305:1130-1807(+)
MVVVFVFVLIDLDLDQGAVGIVAPGEFVGNFLVCFTACAFVVGILFFTSDRIAAIYHVSFCNISGTRNRQIEIVCRTDRPLRGGQGIFRVVIQFRAMEPRLGIQNKDITFLDPDFQLPGIFFGVAFVFVFVFAFAFVQQEFLGNKRIGMGANLPCFGSRNLNVVGPRMRDIVDVFGTTRQGVCRDRDWGGGAGGSFSLLCNGSSSSISSSSSSISSNSTIISIGR